MSLPPEPGRPPLLLPPLLLHVFPSFAFGGAQMRFTQVANHFGARWRHMVVAMDGDLACRARLDPALDVSFPDAGLVKGDTWRNLRRIRRRLAAWRPDVLVTSNWGSIEWALARILPIHGMRLRHIHTEDGFGPEEQARQLPRRVHTRRVALRGATVVLPSRTLLRIATTIWRLAPGRLRYIPNGVDLARFGPRPGDQLGGTVIGAVAALRAEKNLTRLLRAFHAVADQARLVIVGDGPERPALQAMAATLGLTERVCFTGHLAQPDAAYRSFDVFALSSDTEQMPLSVLEAMAAGLPVVATGVGDIADMVAAPNLPFITGLAPEAMAAAFAALLGDQALRKAVGAANREKAASQFDQATMLARYAALFDDSPAMTG